MKIVLITSTRADYGLLKPVIRKMHADKFFDLKIIATGTHLSKEFGNTYKEIEEDGFAIFKKVPILEKSDTPEAITKVCSTALDQFGQLYKSLKPDAVLVLGDRYEIFCGVFAALFFKIPVIHYSGGEKTEGAYDDVIRHSITKLSHLHFVSCEEYKTRVIQLGEAPSTVFNTGSLGLDNIKHTKLLSKSDFEKSINFKLGKENFLVSFHPETLSRKSAKQQFTEVLKALEKHPDTKIIFTKSNADNDGRIINRMIDEFVKENKNRIAFDSLGLLRYLSAIKHCTLVLGNSSSGITEVPFFAKPTVNIGNRQKGRVLSKSVVNCETDSDSISRAIKNALNSSFLGQLKNIESPFGNGNASRQIISVIKNYNFGNAIPKVFYDLKK